MAGMDGRTSSQGPAESPAADVPRAYLFALTDGGGTIPPELGVARRLVDRGHRVTVIADATFADQARRTGAAVRAWSQGTDGPFRDWELRSPTSLARGMSDHMIAGPAPAQADDAGRAIDEVRPDLVVTSAMAVGAMIAAEERQVPFDVLIPNVYPMPAPGAPPFGAGLSPARGPFGRVRDRILGAAGVRLMDRYALPGINAVRGEHHLDPIETMWRQLHHARRQLVLTSSAFDFPETLPEIARYVGPILDDPAWAAEAAWEPPPGDAPLVLVAMSSTFQNHVACLQRITDALGGLPVRGVVTTGPAVQPSELRATANVDVVASAPHREVLPRASLVITHGGHGTVIKALAAGVPLVILHHGRDQADNAARVVTRGAGVSIPRGSSSARIARAVVDVLGDAAFARAAARLGEAIRRDAAGPALLDELEWIGAPGGSQTDGA